MLSGWKKLSGSGRIRSKHAGLYSDGTCGDLFRLLSIQTCANSMKFLGVTASESAVFSRPRLSWDFNILEQCRSFGIRFFEKPDQSSPCPTVEVEEQSPMSMM